MCNPDVKFAVKIWFSLFNWWDQMDFVLVRRVMGCEFRVAEGWGEAVAVAACCFLICGVHVLLL